MKSRRLLGLIQRQDRGFTLIEALGSMAIVSTLFLGVAGMILNYTHVQRVNAAHSSVNRLTQILRDRLRYDTECSQALRGNFNPVLSSTSDLKLGTEISLDYRGVGLGVIQKDTELPEFNVRVDRLNIIGAALQGSFMSGPRPRNVYKVSVVLAPSALSVSGMNTSLSPRIVSSVMIGVDPANNIIGCENGLYGTIRACSDSGMIYAPLGMNGFNPDGGGCISPTALKGPPGDVTPGPQGPDGNSGPSGIPGSPGVSVPDPGPIVLPPVVVPPGLPPAPPPPPPPPPPVVLPLPRPPKSDLRVKDQVMDLSARFAPAGNSEAEERQTLTMKLIRTLQEQQKQIRALEREVCLEDAKTAEEVRKCESASSTR